MGDQTTTTEQTVGPQSAQAQEMMRQLMQLTQQSQGQLGDLSDLAAGNIQAGPQDRRLVEQSANAAAEMARRNAERDFLTTSRQTEDQLVSRGVDSSTIDAVVQALQGRQYQHQLGQIGLQQQGQSAEMMASMPLQRAGIQLNANQAILQRILGGAQPTLNYDIQARLGNMTQQTTKPFDLVGMAQGVGQTVASKPWGG